MCRVSIFSISIVLALVAVSPSHGREWTDEVNKVKFEADIQDLSDNAVKLRRKDGKDEIVPVKRLCDEDVKFLLEYVKDEFKCERVSADVYLALQKEVGRRYREGLKKKADEISKRYEGLGDLRVWRIPGGSPLTARLIEATATHVVLLNEEGSLKKLAMTVLSVQDQQLLRDRIPEIAAAHREMSPEDAAKRTPWYVSKKIAASLHRAPPPHPMTGLWYGWYKQNSKTESQFMLLITGCKDGIIEGQCINETVDGISSPAPVYSPFSPDSMVSVRGVVDGNKVWVGDTDRTLSKTHAKKWRGNPWPFILDGTLGEQNFTGVYTDPYTRLSRTFSLGQCAIHSRIDVGLAVTVRLREPAYFELRGILKSIEPDGTLNFECREGVGKPTDLAIPTSLWWALYLGNEAEYARVDVESLDDKIRSDLMPADFDFCVIKTAFWRSAKKEAPVPFMQGWKVVRRKGATVSLSYPSPYSIIAAWKKTGDVDALKVPYTWTPQYAAEVASRKRIASSLGGLGMLALAVKDYKDPTKTTVIGQNKVAVGLVVKAVKAFSRAAQAAAEDGALDSSASSSKRENPNLKQRFTIKCVVVDRKGQPVPGLRVAIYTGFKILVRTSCLTNRSGVAEFRLPNESLAGREGTSVSVRLHPEGQSESILLFDGVVTDDETFSYRFK